MCMHKVIPGWLMVTCFLFLAAQPAARADPSEARWEIPDSLAAWYKPQNKRQVWLHTMFALRRELQAVEEYAASGDRVRTAAWAGRFAEHYFKIKEMVPEWADELDLDALADLQGAAASGDLEGVAAVRRPLVRTCKRCHQEFRALVAARFRAPDFSALTVSDKEGRERGFAEHMDLLSRSVNRINIASEDARWEAAGEALTVLRAELALLGETCSSCHSDDPPRERILGAISQAGLDQVARGIEDEDPKQVGGALGHAAVDVCARCHGVHRLLSDLTGAVLPSGR